VFCYVAQNLITVFYKHSVLTSSLDLDLNLNPHVLDSEHIIQTLSHWTSKTQTWTLSHFTWIWYQI